MNSEDSLLDFDFSARIAQLDKELSGAQEEELELDKEILKLISLNQEIPRQMSVSVNRMKTQLALIESDSSQLSSMLSLTLVLAENISGKVRELDLAKGRVVETLQRVEDILDLKFCTEGVQTAMQNEDFEQAAGHIHRFLSLDESVLQMSQEFERSDQLSGAQPDSPPSPTGAGASLKQSYEVLRQAESSLKETVRLKFDEAVASGDVASMERFFKIFPLLNQHQLGLEKFGSYLAGQIVKAGENAIKTYLMCGGESDFRSNVLYPDALTLLFEGVARIVEIHQPLVETYYGPERMLTLVQLLQKSCDQQADIIIKEFLKARQYNNKARLVDSYNRNASKFSTLEKLDPLELDVLLSEVTLMHTRAELYLRFIKRRVGADLSGLPESHKRKPQLWAELETLIKDCLLSRTMQELIGKYIAMEEYFLRESVKKAIALDAKDSHSLCSSMCDDIFFIVKKCVRRSLSSSSVDGVCAMLNHACSLLEDDYRGVIVARLKGGYPTTGSLAEAYTTAAAAYSSVLQQGKMSSTGETAERVRDNFITALNNADVSREYGAQLKESLWADIQKQFGHLNETDGRKLEFCLSNLAEVSAKFRQTVEFGLEQLVVAAVGPRLKTWAEAYFEVSHAPNETEFADYEVNDPFIKNFITNLDGIVVSYKEILNEATYDNFVGRVATEVSQRLEKTILKCSFNRLGGLQLDKEIRELTAYLTSITSWAVREKFARMAQIAMLLNVDGVQEAKDLYNTSSITWRLTPNEVRQVLSLRKDLSTDDVRRLKL